MHSIGQGLGDRLGDAFYRRRLHQYTDRHEIENKDEYLDDIEVELTSRSMLEVQAFQSAQDRF